eukprot:TRINITY_DN20142_c0_g1_i1.p1 TRINITY_DN20142_c0_g1~~TRINITY_DN20142_c0_g1_i1.p1  ORF type:complete len:126 (-),score=17.69 TRINITY_DN20142_c0_g1_i1:206-583(-)
MPWAARAFAIGLVLLSIGAREATRRHEDDQNITATNDSHDYFSISSSKTGFEQAVAFARLQADAAVAMVPAHSWARMMFSRSGIMVIILVNAFCVAAIIWFVQASQKTQPAPKFINIKNDALIVK